MKDANKTEALLYTIQIFKYFQARSGKSAALTLDEWKCIQQWREQGLEVEAILKGIDLAWSMNTNEINSLVHCAKAVKEVTKTPS